MKALLEYTYFLFCCCRLLHALGSIFPSCLLYCSVLQDVYEHARIIRIIARDLKRKRAALVQNFRQVCEKVRQDALLLHAYV